MVRSVATGLPIASLILLLIYGADVAVASSSPQGQGFLPFDEAIRGGAWRGANNVDYRFRNCTQGICSDCSSLLFVNGGLIIAGMIALVAQGSVESEDMSDTFRTIDLQWQWGT